MPNFSNSGVTIIYPNRLLIPSSFLAIDHRMQFKLKIGVYDNIISFFNAHNMQILSTLEIDFTKVPINLRGNGTSKNLSEYLDNNSNDVNIIFKFLNYFITIITDMTYNYSSKRIQYRLSPSTIWQTIRVQIFDPFLVPYEHPTTRLNKKRTEFQSFFNVYDHIHNFHNLLHYHMNEKIHLRSYP